MAGLIITADIHGSLDAWKKILSRVGPEDHLAVAGDLFDTVYGSPGKDDFHPDIIKKDAKCLAGRLHYVYGNCDREDYFKGHGLRLSFDFEGLSILLNHGHHNLPDLTDYTIIIEGHSHIPRLDALMGKFFVNPGSPTYPRSAYASYALLENKRIQIREFTCDTVISELNLSDFSV